jgi:hypothetical protein
VLRIDTSFSTRKTVEHGAVGYIHDLRRIKVQGILGHSEEEELTCPTVSTKEFMVEAEGERDGIQREMGIRWFRSGANCG